MLFRPPHIDGNDPSVWRELAQQLRVDAVRATAAAGSGRPSSEMSAADLMSVLFARYLRDDFDHPEDPGNDHLIFSKGQRGATMTVTDPTQAAAHPNAALINGFHLALTGDDPTAASAYLTPDFIMHVPGHGLNAGDYWGHDGFQTFAENIRGYNGGRFELRVGAAAVADAHVFTRETVTLNRREDPQVEWELRYFMHYVISKGLISEAWTVPEDLPLYDAYWTPGSQPPSPGSRRPSADSDLTGSPSSPDNAALIQRWYGHFWNGELDRVRAAMKHDFVWHTPGHGHLAGDYHGWDGYLAFRDKLLALAGDKYKLDIAALAASDTDAFVKEHIRMNLKRDPTVQTIEVILHVQIADGLIVNVDDIPLDLYAYEAFFRP